MKRTLILFLGLVISSGVTFAQVSDYQTIEDFKATIANIQHQIENSITSKQLSVIEQELDEVFETYESKANLIDRALFPATFEGEIADLKTILITNEHHLLLIEHQREQVFELSNQVTAYRSEIDRLYIISDSLKNEILASQASEAQLSEMITSYRKRLVERDRLIFEMIDSFIVTHQNTAFDELSEGAITNYSISNSQNPLEWISSVLNENIEFTKYQNRLLETEDYIRMYALQQHFEKTWTQVGDDLVTVYGGQNKTEIALDIENSIREWRMSASNRMWASIDQFLEFSNIDLAAFDNTESFFTALDAFIQNGEAVSKNEFLTSNGFAEYQKLAEFWRNTFKNEWNNVSDNAQLLANDQIKMIDAALIQWEDTSRPIHPMLIAIVTIMVVSLLGFLLVMLRSKATR